MTMIAKNGARRLYPRSGSLVLCFDGLYFGPKAGTATPLTKEDLVTVEVLPKKGAVHRIQVTQVVESGKAHVEVWTSKALTFTPRNEKVAKAG